MSSTETLGLYQKMFAAGSSDVDASCEKLLFEISDNPDKVDLIYMDIDFGNRMDGMNASQQLRRIGYTNELVFLTKNTEQVFNSFEVEPMYYMVKSNTNLEKLESVFMRAVKKQSARC